MRVTLGAPLALFFTDARNWNVGHNTRLRRYTLSFYIYIVTYKRAWFQQHTSPTETLKAQEDSVNHLVRDAISAGTCLIINRQSLIEIFFSSIYIIYYTFIFWSFCYDICNLLQGWMVYCCADLQNIKSSKRL